MAKQQGYGLPERFSDKVRPWVEGERRSADWGNGRSIRTLLERAREAHAVRSMKEADADLSKIEIVDLLAAMRR